jgi:hypothetical protein
MLVKIPFGVLPEELDESYPAGQSLAPENLYEEEKRLVLRKVLKFIKNSEGEFTFLYDPSWELEEINEIKKYAKVICSNELSDKKN